MCEAPTNKFLNLAIRAVIAGLGVRLAYLIEPDVELVGEIPGLRPKVLEIVWGPVAETCVVAVLVPLLDAAREGPVKCRIGDVIADFPRTGATLSRDIGLTLDDTALAWEVTVNELARLLLQPVVLNRDGVSVMASVVDSVFEMATL